MPGTPIAFDPKALFDPFAERWMFTAMGDAKSSASSLLIAVSQTSDPTGSWNLWQIDADASNSDWANYPSMGFNKDWIAVNLNMFVISDNAFQETRTYLFDKANLYAGGISATHTLLTTTNGFTMVPALTYDNSLTTLYLIDSGWNMSGTSLVRISTITGSVCSETLTEGTEIPVARLFESALRKAGWL